MKKASKNKNLLLKWLRGESTYAEEKQLRHQAAGDPFLHEAMEGFDQVPEGQHELRLTAINERLGRRISKQKRIPIYRRPLVLSAAASLILAIAVMSWFWWPRQHDAFALDSSPAVTAPAPSAVLEESRGEAGTKEDAIAANIPARREAGKAESSSQLSTASAPAASAPNKPIAALDQPPIASREVDDSPNSKDSALAKELGTATFQPPVEAEAEEELSRQGFVDQVQDIAATPEKLNEDSLAGINAAAEQKKPLTKIRQVTGSVYDQNGAPIAGAKILADTLRPAITDAEGHFVYDLSQSIFEIRVFHSDFLPRNITLQGRDTIAIELVPKDLVVDETRPISQVAPYRSFDAETTEKLEYTTSDSKKLRANRTGVAPDKPASILPVFLPEESPALPEGGVKKFEQYILQNREYPKDDHRQNIRGQVFLQFELDNDGIPTAIKVIESLCQSCDAEAIRLLKAGPRWQTKATGSPVKITMAIGFD